MIFKLVRKSTFEQNYTFYVIIWDFFGRAQSENNFKLFFFFNYVTFTKPHPLNRFVGKFWSSRRKTNYQYYFNMQLKCGKQRKFVRLVKKNCNRTFGVEEFSSVRKSRYVKSKSKARSSDRKCSVKKMCSQACNFIKHRLQQRCFSVKFVRFLRTFILKSICKRLLL